jgi:hypothetical protein
MHAEVSIAADAQSAAACLLSARPVDLSMEISSLNSGNHPWFERLNTRLTVEIRKREAKRGNRQPHISLLITVQSERERHSTCAISKHMIAYQHFKVWFDQ